MAPKGNSHTCSPHCGSVDFLSHNFTIALKLNKHLETERALHSSDEDTAFEISIQYLIIITASVLKVKINYRCIQLKWKPSFWNHCTCTFKTTAQDLKMTNASLKPRFVMCCSTLKFCVLLVYFSLSLIHTPALAVAIIVVIVIAVVVCCCVVPISICVLVWCCWAGALGAAMGVNNRSRRTVVSTQADDNQVSLCIRVQLGHSWGMRKCPN